VLALDVLAATRRREILALIWDRELPVGEIHAANADVTLGAVSQHLAKLHAAGLVRRRVEGRHHYYRADPGAFGPLREALDTMWAAKLDGLKALAEDEQGRSGG
jgi:DNA-binding transcriptional ArsR family regulator